MKIFKMGREKKKGKGLKISVMEMLRMNTPFDHINIIITSILFPALLKSYSCYKFYTTVGPIRLFVLVLTVAIQSRLDYVRLSP